MACISTPTETLFTTITTNTVTTSFSQSVTTFADTTTTVLSTTCLATGTLSNSTSCASTSVITQFSTIAGGTSTTTVAVPATIPVTLTEATATLYSSSCSSDSSTPISVSPSLTSTTPTSTTTPMSSQQSPSDTSSSNANSSPTQSSLSSVTVLSTPLPTIITSQTPTTLPDGSVAFTEVAFTTTLPPSSIVVPTEVGAPQASLSSDSHNNNNARSDLGAIIGGILGGFFGFLGLIGLLWYLWRRRVRLLEAFDDNENGTVPRLVRNITKSRRKQMDIDGETTPRPYQYGLVGSNATSLSSPPLDATQPVMHGRSPSLTPLMLSGSNLSPSQPTTTTTSRPGTSGSFFPQMEDNSGAPVAMLSSRSSSNLGQERERRNSRPSLALGSQLNLDTIDADARSSGLGSPISPDAASRRPPLQVINISAEPSSPVEAVNHEDAGSSTPPTTPPVTSTSSGPKKPGKTGNLSVMVHQDGGRAGSSRNDDPPPYSS